jgi:hypothetical protein
MSAMCGAVFAATQEFARRDFPQSGCNVHRLSRDVTQLLLHNASLPAREIEEAAEWMVKAIGRFGKPNDAEEAAEASHHTELSIFAARSRSTRARC